MEYALGFVVVGALLYAAYRILTRKKRDGSGDGGKGGGKGDGTQHF